MQKVIILYQTKSQVTALKKQWQESLLVTDTILDMPSIDAVKKWSVMQKMDLIVLFLVQDKLTKKESDLLDRLHMLDKDIILIGKKGTEVRHLLRYNIVDFLPIPVAHGDLLSACNRAAVRIGRKQLYKQWLLTVNQQQNHGHTNNRKIAVPTVEGFVFIKLQEIVRCEANGAYTYLFTSKKDKVIASRNIKEYEDTLPKDMFFRIHNSHLINVHRILKYSKGRGGTVTMEDGTQIEVASRRRSQFLNMFQ
ncbi:MAG: LytR/AlgR family response regulator transcription factor [Ferruginibacter sp.]